MSTVDQVLVLFAVENGYVKDIEVSELQRYEEELLGFFHQSHNDLVKHMEERESLNEDIIEELEEYMEDFNRQFK